MDERLRKDEHRVHKLLNAAEGVLGRRAAVLGAQKFARKGPEDKKTTVDVLFGLVDSQISGGLLTSDKPEEAAASSAVESGADILKRIAA